jgi:hypothetical protein
VTGTGDIYYGYNFNKPAITGSTGITGPGYRNFDYKDDTFALGLAEVSVSRATSDTSRFGFTLKLAYGPTVDLLTSAGDTDNKNLLQAYGTYLIPAGKKDITVDAGKFVTHMGNEVIEASGNWNYSRSYLFQYFIPYYHAGVRAAYPISSTVTGTAYVYNGWNNVSYVTNHNKAYGAELVFAPSPSTTWTFNGLTSNEPAGSITTGGQDSVIAVEQPKTTLEGIWSHALTGALTSVIDLNYDFGKGVIASDTSKPNSGWDAYGVAAYLRYVLKNGNAVSLRGEYARDPQGFLGGIGDVNLKELTATYSVAHSLYKGGELRLEYRYDSASKAGAFLGTNNATHQNSLTIAEVLTFG